MNNITGAANFLRGKFHQTKENLPGVIRDVFEQDSYEGSFEVSLKLSKYFVLYYDFIINILAYQYKNILLLIQTLANEIYF